jgi:hypothetical protein
LRDAVALPGLISHKATFSPGVKPVAVNVTVDPVVTRDPPPISTGPDFGALDDEGGVTVDTGLVPDGGTLVPDGGTLVPDGPDGAPPDVPPTAYVPTISCPEVLPCAVTSHCPLVGNVTLVVNAPVPSAPPSGSALTVVSGPVRQNAILSFGVKPAPENVTGAPTATCPLPEPGAGGGDPEAGGSDPVGAAVPLVLPTW